MKKFWKSEPTGMAFSVEEIKQCRLCGSDRLVTVIDLGEQYVVDFVDKPDSTTRGKSPLQLSLCEECSLVQLRHTVNADSLYTKFFYKSSISEQMIAALREIAERAQDVAYIGPNDRVLDIGCNDGILLGWYPGVVRTVGVDPCGELVEEALRQKRMDVGIKGYFNETAVRPYGPYKAITAISMFYDVPDPIGFLKQCKAALRHDGVMIIQMNYLVDMMNNVAIDNACAEHLTYFSMTTMKAAADAAGLEVVGAETNDVNGGSIRVYLTHKDSGLYGVSTQRQLDLFMTAMNLIHKENKLELNKKETYEKFSKRINARVEAIRNYVMAEAERGQKIFLYGASTRGTVLMQLLNLPDGVIMGVAERDSAKYNLHMVGGTWPKIYPEDYCRSKANQFLCLPWHFETSILNREADFLQRGGKLIFPLPTPRIVTDGGKITYLMADEQVGVD